MADLIYPVAIRGFHAIWKSLGLNFSVSGEENIPLDGGAVLAMNHIGYLDFAIAGTPFFPKKRYVRFMAKKEIFDNKIAGPLMRGMHHIAVDRENGGTSFVSALRALRHGEIVGIFPEATISTSFEIKGMKSGAVRLAMGAGVPVIPLVHWGSQRIWTKGLPRNFRRQNIPIHIAIGKPMYFEKNDDLVKAETKLRNVMIELLHKLQEEYPDSHVGKRWAPQRLGGTAPAPLNS
ncbi:MAG: hypothetical protein RL448_127 [Actinomycetota bacterium]